jgi:predicted MPP superfamily phosphohydrolase
MSNLILTLIFCLTHMVIFIAAVFSLELELAGRLYWGGWLLFMVVSPWTMHFWGVLGSRWIWTAYLIWMGVAFFLFLGGLAAIITGWLAGTNAAETVFLTSILFTPLIIGYGMLQARKPRITEHTMFSDKIPVNAPELRILAFSDLHLGQFEIGRRLDKIMRTLRSVECDVIVALGDILDYGRHGADLRSFAAKLKRLKAPLGKFAVLGNHEFYAGVDKSLAFLKNAGFKVLRGESAKLGEAGLVAGVDDAVFGHEHEDGSAEAAALKARKKGRFTLLLKHRPEIQKDALGLFDLQLSGHTHGGQVYPWAFIDNWLYPYFKGWYELPLGCRLFVTRGVGTWGPPVRIGAPAEAALIRIIRAQSPETG